MSATNGTEDRDDQDRDVDETRPIGALQEPAGPHDEPLEEVPGDASTRREAAYDEVPLTTMLTAHGTDEPARRTHPLSVGHLVCGLVFLGIAASWALRQLDVIESDGEQWVLPLVLVVAGGAGLLSLVMRQVVGRRA